jgi:hypothetical protein
VSGRNLGDAVDAAETYLAEIEARLKRLDRVSSAYNPELYAEKKTLEPVKNWLQERIAEWKEDA